MKTTINTLIYLFCFNLNLFANDFAIGYEALQKKDYVKAEEYYSKSCDGSELDDSKKYDLLNKSN